MSRHGLDKEAYTFQEDGDPKHQSKITKKWKRKEGLKFLENWPANSPDLNPIENLWSILKRRVGAIKPATVEEAKRILGQEWRRLEADGELTKYIPDKEIFVSAKHFFHYCIYLRYPLYKIKKNNFRAVCLYCKRYMISN